MALTGLEIIREVGGRLQGGPHATANAGSFLIMALTMAVNLGVSRYEARKGRELGSDFLIADSLHTKSDLYTSASVLGSLVAVRLGMPLADPLVALVVVVMIVRMAAGIVRDASQVLLDAAPVEPGTIRDVVLSVEGVRGCHEIRTRGRTDQIHVDLHIFVDPDTPVRRSHALSHQVMARLKAKIEGVEDVVIHVEPFHPGHPEALASPAGTTMSAKEGCDKGPDGASNP